MAKTLVIVESPAKAKTIEKFLGKSHYTVKASVGHVRDLPKSTLGVDIDNNFEPRYINIRGKGDLIKELKKEAKKAKRVYLATDPDREGEAISWHLAYILGIDENDECRIEFNEITKDAIKKAIKNPRNIDLKLVDAQQARRVLDRLLGYQISPILWAKVRKGLSAGRVQSVTTKLICEREREINDFVPKEYWSLEIEGKTKDNENITFKFISYNNEKIELKDLSPLEKLHIFVNTKNIEDYPILKHNEFNKVIKINKDTSKITETELTRIIKDKDNNRYAIQEIYKINNFYSLLFLELYFILQEKTYLKKCKNCDKYFLTTNSAIIYCDNVFEDNKTCREIGANKVFTKNLEKDEAYNLYRKVYKKKQALAKLKGGTFEIEYNLFKNQGKDKKNAYKLKEISKKEFIKWLNKQ